MLSVIIVFAPFIAMVIAAEPNYPHTEVVEVEFAQIAPLEPSIEDVGEDTMEAPFFENNYTNIIKDVPEEHIENKEPEYNNVTIQHYTEQDVVDISKVLYSECRGVESKTEQACVAWTILNRVDYHGSTVYSVVRAPNQYAFYGNEPVLDELKELARDVLERWNREKNGDFEVGRVLPIEYIYFEGRDGHNYFRDKYRGDYTIWDYSVESPYES